MLRVVSLPRCTKEESRLLEYRFVQEFIADLAVGIIPFHQRLERLKFRPAGGDVGFGKGEELAPVRADGEGSKGLLDDRQQLLHRGPVALPGEVEGEAVLARGG